MKSRLLYFVLGCLCPFILSAQRITVHGSILDDMMSEALPGASVVLLHPKDSSQAAAVTSDLEGKFKLPTVKAGTYVMRVSYVGFLTAYKNLTLTKEEKQVDLGEIRLLEDAKLMKEAEVVAKVAQVEMKADTFVFNADAYRLPEGSALEELIRKLPGAEVDENGAIKINGKSVSKIMVGGKEFFNNDTKMSMKNLPSKLIKKIKAYDRKSDYSRVTGIDDGEEETVLDLTVQKGMKDGWVANVDLGYGTEDRYTGRVNVNRFLDHSFFSVIGSRNNVNDGNGRWGGGRGVTTSSMAGATFAWENNKPEYSAGLLKIGGNVRYGHSKNVSESRSNSEMFLTNNTSTFSNSRSQSTNRNYNVNANFRLEWYADSMTNILFRPNFGHSNGNNRSDSHSVTFNQNPFLAGLTNPLDEYATYDDPDKIRVNGNERFSFGDFYNNNVDADLQVNRRLRKPGRNVTLNVSGGYSESGNNNYSRALVNYYQRANEKTATYQNTYSPSENYNYLGRLSYSEPIFPGANLQFRYQAQYRFQDSNREMMVYDKLADALANAGLDDISAYHLYTGNYNGVSLQNYGIDLTSLIRDAENSQYATYREFNQSANMMLRYTAKFENEQELRFNAGVNYEPQTTHMDFQKSQIDTSVVRHIQNWAPRIDIRWKISNTSQFRVRYNGYMSQPSMTNLIEVMDSSDPLYISTGNAGLQSSWNDRFRLEYNDYKTEKQMGWNINGWGNINRRSISNSTVYDTESGVRYSRPMNIDGNWNAGTWMGFNTALGAKKLFNLNFNQNLNFSNNVGYVSSNLNGEAGNIIHDFESGTPAGRKDMMNRLFEYMDTHQLLNKSVTKNTSVGENLRLNFRNDLLEVGVNGNMNYNHARNDVQRNANLDTWFFSYGGNVVINAPWNMQFSSDISQQSRRGYDDASMNTNELIWNAQLSQNFLKNKQATISVQWYDILRQRSNISRNISATMRTDSWSNAIHSYVMVHFLYRLNLMGNKSARVSGFNPDEGRGRWGGGGRGGRF